MRDFKRIGGEILSSPLNENFRRLRNDISIANSNLVFSDKYGIMATIQDMENLKDDPQVELTEGQVCYVVSSGELYRFSELDNKWHKIADFGQTFRQAFLNSGVVLVEGSIGVSTDYLLMPRMLVYFKNKPGEDPYLKGMYLIEAKECRVNPPFTSNVVYSIYVDYSKNYHVSPGLPIEDDPNNIFVGAFIPYKGELKAELVYTMPNIAYTADRGQFLISNGTCSGAELYVGEDSQVISRKAGVYYDEGVNYPGESYYTYDFAQLEMGSYTIEINEETIGYFSTEKNFTSPGILVFYPSHSDTIYIKQNDLTVAEYGISTGTMGSQLTFIAQSSIDNYPKSLDDTGNYNIKPLSNLGAVDSYYYSTAIDTISNLQLTQEINDEQVPITNLIYDIYTPKGSDVLTTVPVGSFTIQKHLVTPTGQNIMIYGDTLYESFEDAESHLNDPVELDGDFLYAEVTRVVIQNPDVTFDPSIHCRFYTTNRLTQVGTISPVFADNEFKIYSHDDITPTFLYLNLDRLRDEVLTPSAEELDNYVKEYSLQPDTYNFTHYYFGLNNKYINGSYEDSHGAITVPVTATTSGLHKIDNTTKGYVIGSLDDIIDLRNRANVIESELWDTYRSSAIARYEQSVRYRLYKLENDLYGDYNDSTSLSIAPRLTTAETKIDNLEHLKANKNTTINGKPLGNSNETYEATTVVLYTDDIDEPAVNPNHRWFSQELVKQNDWVIEAHEHVGRKGRGVETNANPHATTTDDITVLANSDNLFLTTTERNKLVNVPANTNQILTDLENNKIEELTIYSLNPTTQSETLLGGIKTLKVNTQGATITVDDQTKIGTLEVQARPDIVMYRSMYTPIADSQSKDGFVDKALFAENINTTGAVASQYYGTDAEYPTTTVGWKSLPVYVSTSTAEYPTVNIDSVLLRPEDRSVALKHLANSRVVYTPADEETDLGDNVYNLVKNHYHQVYNSGTQGPYIEDPNHPGTYIQDTSGIIYTYKVPYGGMIEHAYYFEYNNVNYTFSTTNLGTIAVNTILTYIPSSGNIGVTIGGTTRTLTTNQVQPTAVDDDYFITFVAQTDWSKINKWNFGDNLSVTVTDGIATINAFNATSDTPVHAFVNLDDVDFLYSGANPGQMIVINDSCDGVTLSNAPSMSNYMLISDYVNAQQPSKVNAAVAADTAANAANANLLQNIYSVSDGAASTSTLWSSNKTNTIISTKIATEGVRTDYGTTAPGSHSFPFNPKQGDLYILIE